ncbi:hypothetical protein [Proteiniphilum sp. X52]|uniref:hypothetical protein n=1 Tax=Proteiniphilum sp. X52 TaxID=2382159 RepID=UPI0011CD9AF5|nr:hypothetical protein [Proteiniphilum sp. X52]
MERIVLEVDSETAKKWRITSQHRKAQLAQEINLKLARDLSNTREEFLQFLDEVGKTMEERGLTEEILQQILRDEE